MNVIKRLAETEYVRSAMAEKSDLSAFKQKPSVRTMVGLAIMGFSYIIGWPAIGILGAISVYLNRPVLIAVGGPALYGLSHLVFMIGMYLAGAGYTRTFFRWATRVAMERLTANRSRSG